MVTEVAPAVLPMELAASAVVVALVDSATWGMAWAIVLGVKATSVTIVTLKSKMQMFDASLLPEETCGIACSQA